MQASLNQTEGAIQELAPESRIFLTHDSRRDSADSGIHGDSRLKFNYHIAAAGIATRSHSSLPFTELKRR
jgi:hypothetical protein